MIKYPTFNVRVDFLCPSDYLPDMISINHDEYTVLKYYHNSMRCYTWQKFGHAGGSCKIKLIKCGICIGKYNTKDCVEIDDIIKC